MSVVIDGAHALNFTYPVTVAGLVSTQFDGMALTEVELSGGSIEVLFDGR